MKSENLNEKVYLYNLSTIDSHLRSGIDVGRAYTKILSWFENLEFNLAPLFIWLERSQQRRALLKLDDHLLKDVGISPLQADREGTKWFWQS